MPLEQLSHSQVVTLAPPGLPLTMAVSGGGYAITSSMPSGDGSGYAITGSMFFGDAYADLGPLGGTAPWSFTVADIPLGSYFVVSNAQAALISAGNVFTDEMNPGTVFTVTPGPWTSAFGFTNVTFTPSAVVNVVPPDVITQVSPAILPLASGDRFRLWNAGTLKEPTVFTVTGLLLNTANQHWDAYFTPSSQVVPANGDTLITVPAPKSPRWLGAIGHVSALVRGYSCPGGPDALSLLLRLPADYRTDALNPGRVVQVWRGGSCVWEGKLDEPAPTADGWTVTAHGAGTYGDDFTAVWAKWNSDDAISRAVNERGLRWVNPGIGSPSGIYLGQVQDSGSLTITAFLNLLITGGGLVWTVSPGNASTLPAGPWVLNVKPFTQDANGNPTRPPDRILISSTPVARTIAADINSLVLRYQMTADTNVTSTKKAVAATFGITLATNQAAVNRHGPMEYYIDLSSAGVLSKSQAQAIGQNILTRYIRANWAGPFTAGPGQVLNAGGQPVDLGSDQAGLVYQVMVTDGSYGGEVAAAPLLFLSGGYEFDEDSSTATITPYQGVRSDLASLIGALYPSKF
jgi:hypothetical protein